MRTFLKRFLLDVKNRKNLELYISLFAAIGILITDILGLTEESYIDRLILISLSTIILSLIEERHSRDRIEKTLRGLSIKGTSGVFKKWDSSVIRDKMPSAHRISLFTVDSFTFLTQTGRELKDFVRRGGLLRCILLDPNGQGIRMVSDRSIGARKNPKFTRDEIYLSLQRLGEIAESAADPGGVQVKIIDHLPFAVVTMVDEDEASGVIYVTPNGFEQEYKTRPSFVLSKEKEPDCFRFYQESFENMWVWKETRAFDLHSDLREENSK